MGLLGSTVALLILIALNYWAARAGPHSRGRLGLLTTSLPALGLIAFTGWRFGYAVLNEDEVNRRFHEGDLSYFGADMAFGISVLFGSAWILAAYVGFCWGRRNRIAGTGASKR
jgi:hypothetical protein